MTTVAAILRHKGSDVVTVAPETPIAEVARILRDRRIGAVLLSQKTGSRNCWGS